MTGSWKDVEIAKLLREQDALLMGYQAVSDKVVLLEDELRRIKAQPTPDIEVGDWVKYSWGRGQFTIAVVHSTSGASPQAIEAHPSLKDLVLYDLSNGACLRAEAFDEVRKKSSGTK